MGTKTGTSKNVSDETARERLAERLRELRSASGLSLRDLERKVHTSDSSLSRYLAGRALPPWQVVTGLCELAGADPDELRDLWERAQKPGQPAGSAETDADEPPRPRRAWRRDALVLVVGVALGLGAPPVARLASDEIYRVTHRPPPPNPLIHENPASGPAGRFDYVTDPYVRTKTQPGEFRITLHDSPSGWLCVKLLNSRTGRFLGRPECVNNGDTKTMVSYIPAVTKFQVEAMSGDEGQYHCSMYY